MNEWMIMQWPFADLERKLKAGVDDGQQVQRVPAYDEQERHDG